MPRRRPSRLRRKPVPVPGKAQVRGLPAVTAEALGRLDDPELDPSMVADELETWRTVVRLPASVLSAPHNDWTEFIGPSARSVLESAVQALNRHDGASLRNELAKLDAEFERKTSPNPFADQSLPWWARRWWH